MKLLPLNSLQTIINIIANTFNTEAIESIDLLLPPPYRNTRINLYTNPFVDPNSSALYSGRIIDNLKELSLQPFERIPKPIGTILLSCKYELPARGFHISNVYLLGRSVQSDRVLCIEYPFLEQLDFAIEKYLFDLQKDIIRFQLNS